MKVFILAQYYISFKLVILFLRLLYKFIVLTGDHKQHWSTLCLILLERKEYRLELLKWLFIPLKIVGKCQCSLAGNVARDSHMG